MSNKKPKVKSPEIISIQPLTKPIGIKHKINIVDNLKNNVKNKVSRFLNLQKKIYFILGPRQMGKTTILLNYVIKQIKNNNQRILFVSTSEASRTHKFGVFLTLLAADKRIVQTTGTANTCNIINGSKVTFITANELIASSKGAMVNTIIFDDAEYMDDSIFATAWKSIWPVLSASKTSKIIIASGSMYTDTQLYKIYKLAKKHDEVIRISASEAHSPERLKVFKQNIGSEIRYKAEFGATFLKRERKLTTWDKIVNFLKDLYEAII